MWVWEGEVGAARRRCGRVRVELGGLRVCPFCNWPWL